MSPKGLVLRKRGDLSKRCDISGIGSARVRSSGLTCKAPTTSASPRNRPGEKSRSFRPGRLVPLRISRSSRRCSNHAFFVKEIKDCVRDLLARLGSEPSSGALFRLGEVQDSEPVSIAEADQRRLKSSAFLDANSSSVRMFFWRSSARRSIVLTMSSVAGCAAGGGAAGETQRRVSDRGACAGNGAEPDGAGVCEVGSPSRTNQRQVGDAHEAVLAGEGQRLIAALLLGESRERVVAGVVDATGPPSWIASRRVRKEGVAHIVLRAGGGGSAEFARPPLAPPAAPPRTG